MTSALYVLALVNAASLADGSDLAVGAFENAEEAVGTTEKLREKLKEVHEHRFADGRHMSEEARRTHAKVEAIKDGLQKERSRLAEFKTKEDARKKTFDSNIDSFDVKMKDKLSKAEETFKDKEEASTTKFEKDEKDGLSNFKAQENSILSEMKAAFNPPDDADDSSLVEKDSKDNSLRTDDSDSA